MTRSSLFVRFSAVLMGAVAFVCGAAKAAEPAESKVLRPPAAPLVTFNPYLSVWSEADKLTDDTTRHWTGHEHALESLIRIDGKTYRLMGKNPADAPPMPQISVKVWPTRTVYQFADSHVRVELTFMTTALPHNLDALAQPLSYLSWEVASVDGAKHNVSIYDSVSSQLVVNSTDQKVTWSREPDVLCLKVLKMGSADQPLLQRMGDDTRIDWGYVYLAAPATAAALGSEQALTREFVASGKLPAKDDTRLPRAAKDDQPTAAIVFALGEVGAEPVTRTAIVAYDEVYSIKFFNKNLRPYWRRKGATPSDMLRTAVTRFGEFRDKCKAFDEQLMADLERVGGKRYAEVAALSYRQALAATGLAADANGQPLMFTKENTSNGDLATVDVIFPMHPILLALSPPLAKASLVPVLNYAASSHWKFPNAPHDLGTYPVAMGRDDGGEGMPVEESGNMLILCDAISQIDGNTNFAGQWWPQLTDWAVYLEKYGLDPEEQLCTDDFMGHLAHNSNLSVKAILGLAAYGDMCRIRGDKERAEKYRALAKKFAAHWVKAAGDGDHYNLAFDKPKTWSQKYNLVWDKLLDLDIFPPEVAREEVSHYKRVMQKYGVPLDSRTKLTKTDWSLWIATLADNQADFEAIVSPIYDYLNETPTRVPLVDSYVTDDVKSNGMHARPVVGGIFVKMLADPEIWKKWAKDGRANVGPWAPLPVPPQFVELVPTSRKTPQTWRYTITKPAGDWTAAGFDDSTWKSAPGPFGTAGTPGIEPNTTWKTDDIWLRREVTLPAGDYANAQLLVYHDEDVEVYFDGVQAGQAPDFMNSYIALDISGAAHEKLHAGAKLTLAVHCHQTVGGQGVDVGIVNVVEKDEPQRK